MTVHARGKELRLQSPPEPQCFSDVSKTHTTNFNKMPKFLHDRTFVSACGMELYVYQRSKNVCRYLVNSVSGRGMIQVRIRQHYRLA